MSEQTTPETGVSQEADVLSRMSNFIAQSEDPAPEAATEQPAPEQQQADQAEVTLEDLPEDPQPASDVEFEIVHNGQTHKIASREEQIRLMQQGFDYTQKTQAVAAKDRQIAEQLQRLAQAEQVTPYLQNQLAQVKAMEAQLAPYQNLDWVRLASDDPLAYPRARAQYDVLVQGYQRAVGQYQEAQGVVGQQLKAIRAQRLNAEAQRLPELVPEWRDAKKLDAARADIAKHYQAKYGIDPQVLDARMDDAVSMAVVYKAMKYDQLLQAKGEKVNQLRTVPPVTRPGAAQGRDSARADKDKELSTRLRKSGSLEDAAALLLNRGLIK